MKKTGILVALIVVLLIGGLFVLTGCGDNKEQASGTSSTNNAQVQATEFYIQNSFPNATTVKEVYATVSGMDAWTPNLIAGLELTPGTRAKIGLGVTESTSNWDFKLVDSEGTAVTFSSVNLGNILSKTAESVVFTVDGDGDIAAKVQ